MPPHRSRVLADAFADRIEHGRLELLLALTGRTAVQKLDFLRRRVGLRPRDIAEQLSLDWPPAWLARSPRHVDLDIALDLLESRPREVWFVGQSGTENVWDELAELAEQLN